MWFKNKLWLQQKSRFYESNLLEPIQILLSTWMRIISSPLRILIFCAIMPFVSFLKFKNCIIKSIVLVDWRVRPIVSIVKKWAKRCNINDASRSSFTSYSLVLMVIHYLQVGLKKPVLPSLQKAYPQKFSAKSDVRMLNILLPLDDIPSSCNFVPNEDSTLGELLLGFFHYYAHVHK